MLFKKKKLPVKRTLFDTSKSTIDDVVDGSIYKNFRRDVQNSKNAYSFTLSTDGVNLCEKSNLSIWPVFLAINEIPIEERFYWENVLLIGKIIIFRLVFN